MHGRLEQHRRRGERAAPVPGSTTRRSTRRRGSARTTGTHGRVERRERRLGRMGSSSSTTFWGVRKQRTGRGLDLRALSDWGLQLFPGVFIDDIEGLDRRGQHVVRGRRQPDGRLDIPGAPRRRGGSRARTPTTGAARGGLGIKGRGRRDPGTLYMGYGLEGIGGRREPAERRRWSGRWTTCCPGRSTGPGGRDPRGPAPDASLLEPEADPHRRRTPSRSRGRSHCFTPAGDEPVISSDRPRGADRLRGPSPRPRATPPGAAHRARCTTSSSMRHAAADAPQSKGPATPPRRSVWPTTWTRSSSTCVTPPGIAGGGDPRTCSSDRWARSSAARR